MAPARKTTRKRTTAKRTIAKRTTSTSKRRYTDAQVEDALDALAAGNIHNAQTALNPPEDVEE